MLPDFSNVVWSLTFRPQITPVPAVMLPGISNWLSMAPSLPSTRCKIEKLVLGDVLGEMLSFLLLKFKLDSFLFLWASSHHHKTAGPL